MSESIAEQKAALRRRVRDKLRRLPPAIRLAESERVCSRLLEDQAWRAAGSVLLYWPLPDEIDVKPLWREAVDAGKILALPRFDAENQRYTACRVLNLVDDIRPGAFGIPEPRAECAELDLNRLDFVLTPGVAFTRDGRRLGRGKGYYDRLLSSVTGLKCGIAFNEQIVEDIPTEPHDVRLDSVLTPERWHRSDRNAVLT